MLINLRNALMAGKRLPYDAEVEYLESTGTQWIATGISAARTSSSIKIVATLKFTDVSTGEHDLAGSGNATTPTMGRNGSNYFMWAKGGTSWYPAACDTNWHTVSYTFNQPSGRVFELDGVSYTGSQSNTFATGDGIHIFASGPNRYPLNCQLSKLEIWQNGVLVRDYIPVRKGTVGYLYDRVSGKLFGNAGTGDFVVGPDVVPVEYIESRSNHAQVIDTGFYANQNTKALITFEKLGADGWLFGSRNGSSSATDKFGIFAYQSPGGKISAQVGNAYIEPIISGGLTNRKRTIGLSLSDGVIVDGETIATFSESQKSQTFTSTYPMALFNIRVSSSGFNSGIYCRVYAYQIFGNGLIARNFLPVRVGTEGAMMDVLTRRIYRNAGTGAFGYGNDLKYPIPAE